MKAMVVVDVFNCNRRKDNPFLGFRSQHPSSFSNFFMLYSTNNHLKCPKIVPAAIITSFVIAFT